MDITDKFNSYFEEGGRLFKRAQFDMNVGKDEFEVIIIIIYFVLFY